MKTTPFTDDLFIGRNYQQHIPLDWCSPSSYDLFLASSTRGRHSLRCGQVQEPVVMPRKGLVVSKVEGKGEKKVGGLQGKIQAEKAPGQQGREAMVSQQEVYEEELKAQLQEWEEQVALYQAKAERATDSAREEFFEITAALQRMQDETRMKLRELSSADGIPQGFLRTAND